MTSTKPSQASKEDLLRLYDGEKRTLVEIGKIFSVSDTTIGTWLKNYGIQRRTRTLPTEKYIERCKAQWVNKYDYTETVYVAAKAPVTIICPAHGRFSVHADNHARGRAECPQCQRHKPLDHDRFVELATAKHGSKYDYTEVIDPSYHKKVLIGCPEHGLFNQSVGSHLSGTGCPKCGNINTGLSLRSEKDQILTKFEKVHGDRYDYRLMDYKGLFQNIKIICPVHGEFEQSPGNHLSGKGCNICGRIKASTNKTKTTEWFINQAKMVYGDIYNYSEALYVKQKKPVIIICEHHGRFEKTPDKHLRGQGCPECSLENHAGGYSLESFQRNPELYRRPGYFYVARFKGGPKREEFIKVGVTVRKPSFRWSGLGSSGGYEVEIMYTWFDMIGKCFEVEQKILGELKSTRSWYWPRLEFGGRTECMSLETWQRFEAVFEEKYRVKLTATAAKTRMSITGRRKAIEQLQQ